MIKKISPAVLLLIVDILVILLCFSWSGMFAVKKDTRFFVAQLNAYRGILDAQDLSNLGVSDPVYYRGFKPLYSLASKVFYMLSPQGVMLLLNILFLFGLTFCAYYFFRNIDFEENYAVWGAIWMVVSFPMLKYGLSLVTDISGWFFMTATLAVFFAGLRKNKLSYILYASLIAFAGAMTKETGVLGALFAGLYLLLNYKEWGVKETAKKVALLSFPFFILYGAFSIWSHKMGQPSFMQWYKYSSDIMWNDFHKFRYFVTNEFLAFHALYLLSLFGFILLIKNKIIVSRKWLSLMIAGLVPSLLILLWPVFYYRIMYIQFAFFIPLALYAFKEISKREYKVFNIDLVKVIPFIPPLVSIILFLLIKKN